MGNWDAIRDDPELGFADKFFLDDAKKAKDEKKAEEASASAAGGENNENSGSTSKPAARVVRTPGAIHLVRRADSLLRSLLDVESSRSRSGDLKRERSPTGGAGSPANGQPPKKKLSKPKQPKARDSPAPTASSSKGSHKGSGSKDSGYESMDDNATKGLMRPVRKELKELRHGTEHLEREAKIEALKRCLSGIKRRIDALVAEHQGTQAEKERLRKHCWVFTSYFW